MVTKFWPKPKYGVCGECVDPGNDHENTKRVGRREVVYLPLNKPEGLYFRIKPSFLAICLVISVLFIALLNEKMSRDAAVLTGFFLGFRLVLVPVRVSRLLRTVCVIDNGVLLICVETL